MKYIIIVAFITVIFSNFSIAQKVIVGGYRRGGTNEQIKAMQTLKLKDTLGISIEQAKKVDAIEQDYNLRIRAIKLDTRLNVSEKKSKIQPLETEKRGNLLTVINEQQLAKLEGRKFKMQNGVTKKPKKNYHKFKKKV